MPEKYDFQQLANDNPDILIRYVRMWARLPRRTEQKFKDLGAALREDLIRAT